ncbi:MAG: type I glutamate--ammonia ligase [Nakamurella sp.]
MFSNTDDLLAFIKDTHVEVLDIRFCDLPGVMQHLTVPASTINAESLAAGMAFDGSSVRGFQTIHESDMLLLPDISTARVDPFRKHRTLTMNFFVHDPLTLQPYSRDPRTVARKAEEYLAGSGIADTVYFGTEAEFYIFDDVRYDSSVNGTFYRVDSESGSWNSGREEAGGNKGYKVRTKGGYFPVSPYDHYGDLRDDIVASLTNSGFQVERAHHEVGTGGQGEINYRFNTLLSAADDLMLFKYIVKNTAWAAGKSATFMPKPLFGDNGSGMHCHQSLWANGSPLFYDEAGYGGLSDMARYYIGGILKHAPSLLAFTNPTVNSYRRLVPGYEAPVNLVYSARNRSACIRIPLTGTSPKAKRIEFRCPDPSANPYLALAAQLMAGLDGVRNRIEPPEPIDKDLYELSPDESVDVAQTPASLDEVINHLEADHGYLLEGGVFTPDLIETWIRIKRTDEIEPIRLRPHPYEFALYYDL